MSGQDGAPRTARPRPPAGLKTRGRAFWRTVRDAYDLEAEEVEILTELCRSLDLVEDLQAYLAKAGLTSLGSTGQLVAHPLLAELRQARVLVARLTAQMALPHDDGGAMPSGLSARGSHAANKRWAGHTKVATLDDARRYRRG